GIALHPVPPIGTVTLHRFDKIAVEAEKRLSGKESLQYRNRNAHQVCHERLSKQNDQYGIFAAGAYTCGCRVLLSERRGNPHICKDRTYYATHRTITEKYYEKFICNKLFI